MDLTPTAQDMLRAMLNKPLFVALRNPADLSKSAALLEAHLQWAVAAERRGELFASGPFIAEGAPPGSLGGHDDRARGIAHGSKKNPRPGSVRARGCGQHRPSQMVGDGRRYHLVDALLRPDGSPDVISTA